MNAKLINTIIFDFGGTLDTDGIHWSHIFFEKYLKQNFAVSREEFVNAYIFAERQAGKWIQPKDSFFTTLNTKVTLQLEYINTHVKSKGRHLSSKKELVLDCYNDVMKNIKSARVILETLRKNYTLGIASNFYGNLVNVLEELSIMKYFSYVFDSVVEGFRKPDPEVFKVTLLKLGSAGDKTLVVGDSYSKDIEPAKRVGCKTVWLLNKPYTKPVLQDKADYIISSLGNLSALDLLTK